MQGSLVSESAGVFKRAATRAANGNGAHRRSSFEDHWWYGSGRMTPALESAVRVSAAPMGHGHAANTDEPGRHPPGSTKPQWHPLPAVSKELRTAL